jgi:hypothetical protein
MKRPLLAAWIIWLCTLPAAQATSYYYVFSDGVFYIGADTLMGVMPAVPSGYSGRKGAFQFTHGCKMLVSNTFVVTPLGWDGEMLFIPDRKGNLVKPIGLVPLYPRIRTILSSARNADSAFDQLQKAAEQTSAELFNYRRKIGAPEVASPDIALALFYWKDGIVYHRIIQTKSRIRNHEQVVVSSVGSPRSLVSNSLAGYGLVDAMQIPPTQKERLAFRSFVDIIPFTLSKQSEMTPDAVGPPFTIFKLSAAGGQWSSHGEMCSKNSFLK